MYPLYWFLTYITMICKIHLFLFNNAVRKYLIEACYGQTHFLPLYWAKDLVTKALFNSYTELMTGVTYYTNSYLQMPCSCPTQAASSQKLKLQCVALAKSADGGAYACDVDQQWKVQSVCRRLSGTPKTDASRLAETYTLLHLWHTSITFPWFSFITITYDPQYHHRYLHDLMSYQWKLWSLQVPLWSPQLPTHCHFARQQQQRWPRI